jgi:hypothetical protein
MKCLTIERKEAQVNIRETETRVDQSRTPVVYAATSRRTQKQSTRRSFIRIASAKRSERRPGVEAASRLRRT